MSRHPVVLSRTMMRFALGLLSGGCSLIVPGPDDFTYDLYDAGVLDGALDAAPAPDAETADASCPGTCGGVCTDTRTDPMHCGSCTRSCTPPANGSATCVDAACGFVCDTGYQRVLGGCVETGAARPLAPLSTATVTSRRPTLRWELGARSDGARIEICEDRACASVLQTIDAAGTSARPPTDLPSGVVFWRLFGLAAGAPGAMPSPTWQFSVGVRTADDADTSWGTTLDVNGDGYADLAVGAPGLNATYVYLGGPGGLAATPRTLDGPAGAGGQFGVPVASAGDVNGDGYADLAVGAPGVSSFDGAAYVYLGGPTGVAVTPRTLEGPPGAGGRFGDSVASAGDVNGDGYADLAVGAPRVSSSAGAAYLYLGGPIGLTATPRTLADRGAGGLFGDSVASVGDVNGDRFADLAVGAPGLNATYVYLGGPGGLAATPGTLDGPAAAGGRFGDSVASAGDVNGDGFADLAVGAFGVNSFDGAAYVYLGGPTGLEAMPRTLDGPSSAGGQFGVSVASAGDVNGDGFSDLVIGAFGMNSFDGSAYVHLGGPTGVATTPLNLEGPGGAAGEFGGSVASAGDVNGDGFADLAVGAPGVSSYDGAAYVYLGDPTGLVATPRSLDGPAGRGGDRIGMWRCPRCCSA